MGEHADDALNSMMDDPDTVWSTSGIQICRYCGMSAHWESTLQGWRLFTGKRFTNAKHTSNITSKSVQENKL